MSPGSSENNKDSNDNSMGEKKKKSFRSRLKYVQITKVKKTRRPKLSYRGRIAQVYDMKSEIRGFCLIVANYKFTTLKLLKGYASDHVYLQRVFEELHFKVIVFENLTAGKIAEQFKNYANSLPVVHSTSQHIQPDAFVGIILSHGNDEYIYGKDHQELVPDKIKVDELTNILNNRNCRLLKNKPKMLFIQGCRGAKSDPGIPNENYSPENVIVEEDQNSQLSMDDIYDKIAKPSYAETGTKSASDSKTTLILKSENTPIMTDIMVCYSTLSGYMSYVYNSGSVFCVALAEAIIRYAHNTGLSGILCQISKAVAEEEIGTQATRAQTNMQKQVVNHNNYGWLAELYFNPGHPKSKESNRTQTSVSKSKTPNSQNNSNQTNDNVNPQDPKGKRIKKNKLTQAAAKSRNINSQDNTNLITGGQPGGSGTLGQSTPTTPINLGAHLPHLPPKPNYTQQKLNFSLIQKDSSLSLPTVEERGLPTVKTKRRRSKNGHNNTPMPNYKQQKLSFPTQDRIRERQRAVSQSTQNTPVDLQTRPSPTPKYKQQKLSFLIKEKVSSPSITIVEERGSIKSKMPLPDKRRSNSGVKNASKLKVTKAQSRKPDTVTKTISKNSNSLPKRLLRRSGKKSVKRNHNPHNTCDYSCIEQVVNKKD